MSDTEHRKKVKYQVLFQKHHWINFLPDLCQVWVKYSGKAPGVTVVNEGGDPNGSPKVNIRGLGGINGETPLYVVDGVVFNGTPAINPNDIQDISVLKDASAAIYGAKILRRCYSYYNEER